MIGEALAMVMGNTRVWSAGIYFDQNQFPNRTYFAPYAYKTQLNTRRFQVGSTDIQVLFRYSSSLFVALSSLLYILVSLNVGDFLYCMVGGCFWCTLSQNSPLFLYQSESDLSVGPSAVISRCFESFPPLTGIHLLPGS